MRYTVYRDGRRVGTTANTAFLDGGLQPSTAYRYWVQATDALGRHGHRSHRLRVRTAGRGISPGGSALGQADTLLPGLISLQLISGALIAAAAVCQSSPITTTRLPAVGRERRGA